MSIGRYFELDKIKGTQGWVKIHGRSLTIVELNQLERLAG